MWLKSLISLNKGKEKSFKFVKIGKHNSHLETRHGTRIGSQRILYGTASITINTETVEIFMLELNDILKGNFTINEVVYPPDKVSQFDLKYYAPNRSHIHKKILLEICIMYSRADVVLITVNGSLSVEQVKTLASSTLSEGAVNQIWFKNSSQRLMEFLETNKIHKKVKISGNLTYTRYLRSYKVPYLQYLVLDTLWDASERQKRKLFQKVKYLPKLKEFKYLNIKPYSRHKVKFECTMLNSGYEDNYLNLKFLSFGRGVKIETFFEVYGNYELKFNIANVRRLKRNKIISTEAHFGGVRHPIPHISDLPNVYLEI